MSGKKQHFIPQSLIKGFGVTEKKYTFVHVYPFDRQTFRTSTEGIGAKRYFYSELAKEGADPTLDDRITDYETEISRFLRELKTQPIKKTLDSQKAAELLTHLIIRNAHFRDSTTDGVQRLFDEVTGMFQDRDRTRRAMGLDIDKPSDILLQAVDDAIARYRSTFAQLGLTQEQIRMWALEQAKPLFEKNFDTFAASMADMTDALAPELLEIASKAQRNALEKDMVPAKRVEKLAGFNWRLVAGPSEGFILSDCVAVAIADDAILPASLADADELQQLMLPVSASRMLVGSRAQFLQIDDNINSVMASCGWDFFVSHKRSSKLDEMKNLLRTATSMMFDQVLENVTSEY